MQIKTLIDMDTIRQKAKNTQKETGTAGEKAAINYLQQNGFVIKHTNWLYGHKEIDIIAVKNNTLHIIEVKTRAADSWEEPKDAVVKRKQRNMLIAADAYIQQHNIDMETEFDIVSIIINNGAYEVAYIPCAFTPSELQ